MFLKVYHEQRYQNLIMSTSLGTLSAQVLETLTQTSLNDRDNFISSNRKCRSRMGFRIVSGSDLMVPCLFASLMFSFVLRLVTIRSWENCQLWSGCCAFLLCPVGKREARSLTVAMAAVLLQWSYWLARVLGVVMFTGPVLQYGLISFLQT